MTDTVSVRPIYRIGRYIGLTNKKNSLSVSVSADTVFYIGTFTDTEKKSEFDIYCLYLQK